MLHLLGERKSFEFYGPSTETAPINFKLCPFPSRALPKAESVQ